jgi:dTDP-glucose 4,6-dehydratase
VGAGTPRTNIEVARRLLLLLGKGEELIEYVSDRPGHDRRYSIDSAKVRALGWTPRHDFWQALEQTVAWYTQHRDWWEPIRASFEFRRWWRRNYEERAPSRQPPAASDQRPADAVQALATLGASPPAAPPPLHLTDGEGEGG